MENDPSRLTDAPLAYFSVTEAPLTEIEQIVVERHHFS